MRMSSSIVDSIPIDRQRRTVLKLIIAVIRLNNPSYSFMDVYDL